MGTVVKWGGYPTWIYEIVVPKEKKMKSMFGEMLTEQST